MFASDEAQTVTVTKATRATPKIDGRFMHRCYGAAGAPSSGHDTVGRKQRIAAPLQ